ncbi:isoaspartyl peptidase/L-asparaginase [Sphingomonas sp. 10B4]|uniref:isoaspartyl peptidase/L-asparaginase family protein n=1 Tax=Sphingomonas sp. 10B4 TaxID=3048575 RepID=UPI002AB4CA7E|nr:isoaspartyl peptidase/L-asparaginase [Sphingomonas sp. 10B4]MDY7524463.1 isoaspartyl peptidase/L-asparaginase [Sphingomonas sp. 10B4]MEB0283066.1 isoaspartyl peptidase/L-asparaginase [Sphingomonas sp. 10B4]
MSWTLILHGGAGQMTRDTVSQAQAEGARAALGRALDAGAAVLAADGAALDAVEAAVRVLEDDPHFNSGRGAALTHAGVAELDAAIMDGRDRNAGAVAGVTATRNPVSLARAVMANSPHVLLSGAGADAFSVEQRCEPATQDWLVLPERRAQLDEMLEGGGAFDVDMKYGTVGAVACDVHGHVAAATSTGGVTGKRWGRIGDSPLIGAGTYADDRAGAVSCTGSGEFFIRANVAHEICARVRLAGETLEAAVETVLAEVTALGGTGGIIVAGPQGEALWRFSTPGMYRARLDSAGGREVAVFGDE